MRVRVTQCLATVLLLVPAWAAASDRPSAFLHGFTASPADWSQAADRLRQRVAIEPHLPALPWRAEFESQARSLQATPEYLGLPSSTIAIGHSNGGLVAREWSRAHRLGGIVTIGTPHGGAPILTHLMVWSGFNDFTRFILNQVLSAFSVPSNWWWMPYFIIDPLNFVGDYSVWSVANLVSLLGLQQSMPVAFQMVPDSTYLRGLNSSSNLGRESVEVSARVGIASVARNYFWAGPARAIAPAYADGIAAGLYAAAGGFLAWGNFVLVNSSPADWASIEQGLSLISAAFHILMIDPIYCLAVSRADMSACVPNDGLVPVDSQVYPGAPTLWLDGPAHTQEREQGEDALYYALVNYTRVPSRDQAAAPLPPPPPAPPDASGPEDPTEDGSSGATEPHDPIDITTGELGSGQELRPGDTVSSTNGRRHLIYQDDGNLVLYDENWQPVWSSGTVGRSAGFVAMQGDGNLVVYDAQGIARWASNTAEYTGARLAVQNDGNLVIYAGDLPVWDTGTFIN